MRIDKVCLMVDSNKVKEAVYDIASSMRKRRECQIEVSALTVMFGLIFGCICLFANLGIVHLVLVIIAVASFYPVTVHLYCRKLPSVFCINDSARKSGKRVSKEDFPTGTLNKLNDIYELEGDEWLLKFLDMPIGQRLLSNSGLISIVLGRVPCEMEVKVSGDDVLLLTTTEEELSCDIIDRCHLDLGSYTGDGSDLMLRVTCNSIMLVRNKPDLRVVDVAYKV